VLHAEEELAVLHQRAVATRIKVKLAEHGMREADAFAMFDANRDGNLSPEELYEGLKHVGLRMTPAELRDLIVLFDTDQNGSISLDEFKAALSVPGLDDDLAFNHDLALIHPPSNPQPGPSVLLPPHAAVMPTPAEPLPPHAAGLSCTLSCAILEQVVCLSCACRVLVLKRVS